MSDEIDIKNVDVDEGEKDQEKAEISLEGFLDDNEPSAKWIAKASVFTHLFSNPDYTYQLYVALHPDDKTTSQDEISLMTLESHLLNQQYNDLGFIVGERLIILVEAQSTWSENIVIRVLLYVVQTWYKYIKRKELDVYDDEKLSLPEPELYVIYTGENPESKKDSISLKKDFFNGKDIGVDCKVKVLFDGKKGDIINQYVRFCHVFNEQVRTHKRTRKAVEETIRICQDENVLKDYLEKEKENVMDIMLSLFDEETIRKNHDASVARKNEKKGQEKNAKVMAFLVQNNRSGDVVKASSDTAFLNQVTKEYDEYVAKKLTPAK